MNRGIKKILYRDTTIKRSAPENYTLDEERLYKGAFLYNMPGAFYYKLSKISIRRYFDFSKAGFLLRETYKNYPGKRKKRVLFIKSLLVFLEFTKEKKTGKYYWVADEWSQNYFHWFTDAIFKYYLLKEKEGVARADVDAASRAVVLASILEEVLQNEGSITPFAGDVERKWQVGFHFELERIGQRV